MHYPLITVRWSDSSRCYLATVGADASPAGRVSVPPTAAGRGATPAEAVAKLCQAFDAVQDLADDLDLDLEAE